MKIISAQYCVDSSQQMKEKIQKIQQNQKEMSKNTFKFEQIQSNLDQLYILNKQENPRNPQIKLTNDEIKKFQNEYNQQFIQSNQSSINSSKKESLNNSFNNIDQKEKNIQKSNSIISLNTSFLSINNNNVQQDENKNSENQFSSVFSNFSSYSNYQDSSSFIKDIDINQKSNYVQVKGSLEKQEKIQTKAVKSKDVTQSQKNLQKSQFTQLFFNTNDENSSSTTNTSHLQNNQNNQNGNGAFNNGNYQQFSAQSRILQSQSQQFTQNKSYFMSKNDINCTQNQQQKQLNQSQFQDMEFNTPEKIAQRNVSQSQNFKNFQNINNIIGNNFNVNNKNKSNNNTYRGLPQTQSQPNSIGKNQIFSSLDSARFLKVLGNKLQFQAVPQVDVKDQQNQSSTSFLEKSENFQDDLQSQKEHQQGYKLKNYFQKNQQQKQKQMKNNLKELNFFKNNESSNPIIDAKQNYESKRQMNQSNSNINKALSINTRYANLQQNNRNSTFQQINQKNFLHKTSNLQQQNPLINKNKITQKENTSNILIPTMSQSRQNKTKTQKQHQSQNILKKQPLNFHLNSKNNYNQQQQKNGKSSNLSFNKEGFERINKLHYNDGCMMNSRNSQRQISNRNKNINNWSQHSIQEKSINPVDFDEFQLQNNKISLVASPVSVSKYKTISFRKNCFQSQELNLKDIQLQQNMSKFNSNNNRNSLNGVQQMDFSGFSQPPSDEKLPYDIYQKEENQDIGKQVKTEQIQAYNLMNTARMSYNFKKPSLMDSINKITSNYISPRNKYFKTNNQTKIPNKKNAKTMENELQLSKYSKENLQENLEEEGESFNVDEYDFNYKTQKKQNFIIEKYIPCMLIKADTPSPYFLIYFHGNGEDINQSIDLLDHIRINLNVNILAMEYPGYGVYKGSPNDKIIQEDAEIVYQYLRNDFNLSPKQIILLGRSIGSGVATYLASKQQIGALILVSAFTSIRGVTENLVGTFASYLVKERFVNKENIKNVEAPVLLIHGKKDKLVPYQHSEILKENCKNKNSQILLPDQMTHTEFDFTDDLVIPIYNFLYENGIDLDLEDYLNNITSPRFPETMYYNPQLQLQTVQL
ncbi:hypothetical protein PPERSA_12948 [Pseudocohnilembus persalinus]|uniref:Uncharacterized protein n=1 Tax=Pseudocohnilembus persalinus TaxID=266149 RepID=A0A0V0R1S2_PSEPJ|nr:hypothetical protein PPERSA_12948 [Pseudocohnilembus persalinus]|eukprot:KRX08467.1 hypothetical protein PPERSA_12948 [Pseudocohnilembus persalinus]